MREMEVELGSDHGGFVLEGLSPALADERAIQDNTLLTWWPDTDPELSGFLVQGGSQWGPYAVSVRVLDAAPPPPTAQWEDVAEVSVTSTGRITVNDVVDGPVAFVDAAVGDYRVRLSARGRTESRDRSHAFPDEDAPDEDEEPLEHFVLEVWPEAQSSATVVRQESRYARELVDPPVPSRPSERAPGLEAAWAVVRDLRGAPGARPLPGHLGDLSVQLDVPGGPTKVFNRLRHATAWPPSRGGSGWPDDIGAPSFHDATLPEIDGHYETVGHVVTTMLLLDKPRRLQMAWNWVLEVDASPERPAPLEARPRLLANDSTVTMTFMASSAVGGERRTSVRIDHHGVPAVWIDDLSRLWAWHAVLMAER